MFNHFKEVNPLVKCQERSYRCFLNKMNIGFGKLGDEECENCRAFSLHEHDSKETSDADSERCSVEYNPPPDLLEVIDSWAATLLKDSGIELKEDCSLCSTLHAQRYPEKNIDGMYSEMKRIAEPYILHAIWKKLSC